MATITIIDFYIIGNKPRTKPSWPVRVAETFSQMVISLRSDQGCFVSLPWPAGVMG